MSDDLVKDLRNSGWYLAKPAADRIEKDAAHIDEMYELVAAMNADHTASKTRIEKLEAALRKVCEDWDSPVFENNWDALVALAGVFSERKMIACKALEGKE